MRYPRKYTLYEATHMNRWHRFKCRTWYSNPWLCRWVWFWMDAQVGWADFTGRYAKPPNDLEVIV